jgi:hypothetical protein
MIANYTQRYFLYIKVKYVQFTKEGGIRPSLATQFKPMLTIIIGATFGHVNRAMDRFAVSLNAVLAYN